MTDVTSENNVAIQIVLPDGTLLKRRTDVVTAIKVLDFLTKSIKPEEADVRVPVPVEDITSETHIGPKTETTTSPKYKIPSRGELLKYIRSQDSYVHSVEDIAQEFVGQEVSSRQGKDAARFLNAIRTKLQRVRGEIEAHENGHWEEDRVGQYKSFKFIKSNDLSRYEEGESQEEPQNDLELE